MIAGISTVKAGRFTWIDKGRALTDTVHVDNVVHAIRLAQTQGKGGEAYFITDGGEPISFRDMMTKMAATIGLELPDKNMPGWLARSAAKLLDLVWRLTLRRAPPPIDPHTAALLSRNCTLKIGKAQRELGYEPVLSREAGIAALMQASATDSSACAGPPCFREAMTRPALCLERLSTNAAGQVGSSHSELLS